LPVLVPIKHTAPQQSLHHHQHQHQHMVLSFRVVVAAIAVVCAAVLLPWYQEWRDDSFFVAPVRDEDWLQSLGRGTRDVCAGTVQLELSSAVLDELEKTTVPVSSRRTSPWWLFWSSFSSSQGNANSHRPIGSVKLAYVTTRGCNNTTSTDDTKRQARQRPHMLLLHGTGLSLETYTHSAVATADEQPSVWDEFRQRGYDVTAVDLRGHGLSEITGGPHSLELLAADVAALLRHPRFFNADTTNNNNSHNSHNSNNNNNKVHCFGISAGFGACMSLATYDGHGLVQTLTGNGFLLDRTHPDAAAYIFSCEPVVRLLGMQMVAILGQLIMKISTPRAIIRAMRHTHMNGYVSLASSWLSFNLTQAVWDQRQQWTIPVLYLLPEYDHVIGHTLARTMEDLKVFPDGIGKVVEFPGHSHYMMGEAGGAAKIVSTVDAFIRENERSTS
jgi:pimeloyl-ACP methyl ester carboxylesterase